MPLDNQEFATKVALAWQGGLDFFELFSYASQLEAEGHFALTSILYRTWLRRNQTTYNHFVFFNLGVALSRENDLKAASEAYQQAIQLSAGFLQPRINLGLILEGQGEAQGALEQWRWVIDHAQPDQPDQQDLRAKALDHLERATAAIASGQTEAPVGADPVARAEPEAEALPAPFRPRVTAIVLAGGEARLLPGCLEALAGQSLFPAGELEILVAGAAGEAVPATEAFAVAHAREVQVLPAREGETIWGALDRAVEAARGALLITFHPGDRQGPEGLERLAEALEEAPDLALVYGDEELARDGAGTFATASREAWLNWPDFEPALLFEANHLDLHPMWRKELHGRHGLFDAGLRYKGGYDFWLRLAAAGERFLHAPGVVGLSLQSQEAREAGNPMLATAEAFLARVRNWPQAWGPLPAQKGNYRFDLG